MQTARIAVGDEHFRTHNIPADANHLAAFLLIGEAEKKAGFLTDQIDYLEQGGRSMLRRRQRLSSAQLGNRTEVSTVDRYTFEPLHALTIRQEGMLTLNYKSGEVKRQFTREGQPPESGRAEIPEGCFDVHSLELVIRTLPLEKDYGCLLPFYHGWTDVHSEAELLVEEVDTAGSYKNEDRPVWRLRLGLEGESRIYWIDQENRQILRQRTEQVTGQTFIFDRRGVTNPDWFL